MSDDSSIEPSSLVVVAVATAVAASADAVIDSVTVTPTCY